MGKASQQALKSSHQMHAFASGERIEGIRVHVHGYAVDLHPLTDGGWRAIVRDLPGCASDGDTMVEAVANVDGATHGWRRPTRARLRASGSPDELGQPLLAPGRV